MATTAWRTAEAALVSTIEALTLTYPASTSETLREFEGRMTETAEPDPGRHRRFRLYMAGAENGARITNGQRDVVRTIDMTIWYDARLDTIEVEHAMSADEELLVVRLERTANWPSGIAAIQWLSSSVNRDKPMQPTLTLRMQVLQGLAQ